MRKKNIYQYYKFGYNYFILKHYTQDINQEVDALVSDIQEFFENLEDLELKVTREAGRELMDIGNEVRSLPQDKGVDVELADRVEKAVKKLEVTLEAELKRTDTYMVTAKRFREDYLLTAPENIFAYSIFTKLPDISKYDFKEACRCIAFELPTGAVFHIMRGTEGVLKHYYYCVVRRNRLKKPMWSNMVDHLRKRKRNAPPKELLDNLDNIRKNFRNPTQHPDATYDIEEAQDLLGISIDVVNRMIKDVRKRQN